jgi:hypothetical protein
MNPRRLARVISTGISLLALASAANANTGVPMLFLTLPAMLIALVPIIVLEAIVIGRLLGSSAIARAKSVVVSNVASTVVGLPLTWGVLVALQMVSGGGSSYGIATPIQKFLAVTWQAPWLIPYERDLYWMLPAASLVLLIPFCFTSYFVEAPIVSRLEPGYSRACVRSAVLRANLFSYLILAAITLVWLLSSIQHGP